MTFTKSAAVSVEPEIYRLSRVPVRVSIRLCHESIKLRDLAKIAPGDHLRFNVTCDAAAELMAGPVALATGEAVRHGHQLGFRLIDIERIYRKDRIH